MKDENPAATYESAGRDRKVELIPIALFLGLVLVVALNAARGRKDEVFEGVVVYDLRSYEFYAGQTSCDLKGMRYLLLPDKAFHDVVQPIRIPPSEFDLQHLDKLRFAWKVKLRGDLSVIGRYGFRGEYWRQLEVMYVIDSTQLSCSNANVQ